ncbi:SdiA-regulated domain-containing protein [Paucibacter sp. O1-1]|nr:SdiA-regulated domain-containing protein [Paucibacter sp. O1-1]MDA3826902.1 SdiA-regulated domain-containing protein [Paucibacter sp. O1-1]
MSIKKTLLALALSVGALGASAAGLDLARYQLGANYALDTLGGMGLEASAVTYARDRNSLFFVGDEGLGVVEISLTGQTLGSMRFSGWPANSTHHDAEGLAYLGNGQLVVVDERPQDAHRFTYQAGGSINLANAQSVSFGGNAGNLGTEGISYDPRNGGSFVTVKQGSPQAVLAGGLNFATGVSTMSALFNPALLGLASLSDVQTLASVDALAGTAAADHLLILSLESQRLVEVNRSGQILSSLDLSGLTQQAIEGVTVDEKGIIYLVAEDSGFGNSRLIVLTPVPEPTSVALMLAGLGLLGWRARRL